MFFMAQTKSTECMEGTKNKYKQYGVLLNKAYIHIFLELLQ